MYQEDASTFSHGLGGKLPVRFALGRREKKILFG